MFPGLLPEEPGQTGDDVTGVEILENDDGISTEEAVVVATFEIQEHGRGVDKQTGQITLERQK